MLLPITTPIKKIERYKKIIPRDQLEEIKELGNQLKGLKVNLINSTPEGGGIAELLKNLVPLMKGVGLKAEWYAIPPDKEFFNLTKAIHNALQGKEFKFSFVRRRLYLRYSEKIAKRMLDMKADLWVVHDPQPAGIIAYLPNFYPAISHIHIDTTEPNEEAKEFIFAFLTMYDKVIFSSKEFIKPGIPKNKIVIFPPAIDPLAPKNQLLKLSTAKGIIENFDIDINKPLLTQIARFDHRKDPSGTLRAYQLAKRKIPDLQLALVGFFWAQDDPEAIKIFKEVKKQTKGDPDVFLFHDPKILGSLDSAIFINAFQVGSDVIIQKSTKEGFGLTITEAMWKGKPVVGGNVGGIKLQIKDGINGFLVNNSREAAERIVQLIKNPKLSQKMGVKAKKTVQEKFLIPRLLKDYLRLFKKLM